jgi:hypothetical protein
MSAIRLLPPENTRASLAIDGPASATFNTVIRATAAYEGAAGSSISLALTADGTWVPCVGTLTLAGNAVADETVTIGTTVYTWKANPTTVAFEVEVGASASVSIDNLIAAINLAAGAGTIYGSATTEHPTVRAYAGAGDTMVVHSRPDVLAAAGTLIATTETMTQGSWGAATLADGTDGDNVAFTVTGTAIACSFCSGYTNVEDFDAALAADADVAALVEVLTAGTTPLYRLVTTDDDFTATLLTGGGSTSVAGPSSMTDATLGVELPYTCDQVLVLVRSCAGSGTMTASPVLWGFSPEVGRWYMIGALNAGVAIPETSVSDTIAYAELVVGVRGFSRLYCENAVSGTATEVEVYAHCVRSESTSR